MNYVRSYRHTVAGHPTTSPVVVGPPTSSSREGAHASLVALAEQLVPDARDVLDHDHRHHHVHVHAQAHHRQGIIIIIIIITSKPSC
jgi:hypothetical protein